MKRPFKTMLGYTNVLLAFICLLSWLLNSLGYIKLGDPEAQLIIAPVCIVLGAMLLNPGIKTN